MSKRSKRRREPPAPAKEGTQDAGRGAKEGASRSGEPRGGSRDRPRAAPPDSASARGRPAEAPRPRRDRSAARGAASSWSLAVQIAFVIGVFAVVSLVAELAGAANLGVALGVGQVGFAIAVIYLLVRR